jgi:hypothetical protein
MRIACVHFSMVYRSSDQSNYDVNLGLLCRPSRCQMSRPVAEDTVIRRIIVQVICLEAKQSSPTTDVNL